jgi:hypothetical protein
MASITETGHAKNVANFERLLTDITALGTSYNPSKASIKLTALNTLFTNAKTAIINVNTAESTYKNAITAREVAFASLGKFVTRVNNALKASDSTQQIDENAMSLVRKLQGRRAAPKKTEEEKTAIVAEGKAVKEISSSQMSFDNRLDNFDKLIKLLTTVPAYAPNETDLKLTNLTTLYTDLKAKNTAVISSEIPLTNARIARNELIYKPDTGMIDLTVSIKSYIKSLYGATSPQYKALSKIKFTNHF